MGEIPQYPHYDSESSESEKDSIDASFELIIGSLEFMCEKSFKYLPMMRDAVNEYKPVIDTFKKAQEKYSEFPKYLTVNCDLYEINSLLQEELVRNTKPH